MSNGTRGRSASKKVDSAARWVIFLRHALRNWRQTGAIVPSSPKLARAMTDFLKGPAPAPPRKILEVGAGTGIFTERIVEVMSPDDELVIYEMAAELAGGLKNRIASDPAWKEKRIVLREAAFPEKILEEEAFDAIVCSLPFNNLSSSQLRRALGAFSDVIHPGGVLVFFEYCHVRRVKLQFSNRAEYFRLKRIEQTINSYVKKYGTKKETVQLNVPPAWVHTLHFSEESEE